MMVASPTDSFISTERKAKSAKLVFEEWLNFEKNMEAQVMLNKSSVSDFSIEEQMH